MLATMPDLCGLITKSNAPMVTRETVLVGFAAVVSPSIREANTDFNGFISNSLKQMTYAYSFILHHFD